MVASGRCLASARNDHLSASLHFSRKLPLAYLHITCTIAGEGVELAGLGYRNTTCCHPSTLHPLPLHAERYILRQQPVAQRLHISCQMMWRKRLYEEYADDES